MNTKRDSWKDLFNILENAEYAAELKDFLESEYKTKTIYPKKENIFRCFDECSKDDIKVVIIGQDPYHGLNQANGLAFSVYKEVDNPPSLKNIYKEIEIEFGKTNQDGDLTYLANQGVLLLNKYLTVEEHKPLSHKCKLYEKLFKDIISYLNTLNTPIVYLLWGNEAQKVSKIVANPQHFIINSTHPSPLGANKGGWFNTNLFKNCNEYLVQNNKKPIIWTK